MLRTVRVGMWAWVLATSAAWAAPEDKLKLLTDRLAGDLSCYANNAKPGRTPDPGCALEVHSDFRTKARDAFSRDEFFTAADFLWELDNTILRPMTERPQSTCAAAGLKEASKLVKSLSKAHVANAKSPDAGKLATKTKKALGKSLKKLAAARRKDPACKFTDHPAFAGIVMSFAQLAGVSPARQFHGYAPPAVVPVTISGVATPPSSADLTVEIEAAGVVWISRTETSLRVEHRPSGGTTSVVTFPTASPTLVLLDGVEVAPEAVRDALATLALTPSASWSSLQAAHYALGVVIGAGYFPFRVDPTSLSTLVSANRRALSQSARDRASTLAPLDGRAVYANGGPAGHSGFQPCMDPELCEILAFAVASPFIYLPLELAGFYADPCEGIGDLAGLAVAAEIGATYAALIVASGGVGIIGAPTATLVCLAVGKIVGDVVTEGCGAIRDFFSISLPQGDVVRQFFFNFFYNGSLSRCACRSYPGRTCVFEEPGNILGDCRETTTTTTTSTTTSTTDGGGDPTTSSTSSSSTTSTTSTTIPGQGVVRFHFEPVRDGITSQVLQFLDTCPGTIVQVPVCPPTHTHPGLPTAWCYPNVLDSSAGCSYSPVTVTGDYVVKLASATGPATIIAGDPNVGPVVATASDYPGSTQGIAVRTNDPAYSARIDGLQELHCMEVNPSTGYYCNPTESTYLYADYLVRVEVVAGPIVPLRSHYAIAPTINNWPFAATGYGEIEFAPECEKPSDCMRQTDKWVSDVECNPETRRCVTPPSSGYERACDSHFDCYQAYDDCYSGICWSAWDPD